MRLTRNLNLAYVDDVFPSDAQPRLVAEGREDLVRAIDRLSRKKEGRRRVHDELAAIEGATHAVVTRWAPIMITQPREAESLSRVAEIHRHVVTLRNFLSTELLESPILFITFNKVAAMLSGIVFSALEQDYALFRAS